MIVPEILGAIFYIKKAEENSSADFLNCPVKMLICFDNHCNQWPPCLQNKQSTCYN